MVPFALLRVTTHTRTHTHNCTTTPPLDGGDS